MDRCASSWRIAGEPGGDEAIQRLGRALFAEVACTLDVEAPRP